MHSISITVGFNRRLGASLPIPDFSPTGIGLKPYYKWEFLYIKSLRSLRRFLATFAVNGFLFLYGKEYRIKNIFVYLGAVFS